MTDAPAVKLRNLGKRFKDGAGAITVLKDVNLEVFPGELVALLGPSGSGKSTLLHLMGALDAHYEGSVAIQGQELKAMKDRERSAFRSEKIGFVFQFFHLVPSLTAFENVLVPMEIAGAADARTRATSLLSEVGLDGRAHHYPAQLSGGEQQRVAIARALANNPPILLADEPTGNLDSANGRHVVELLRTVNVSRRTTIVLVTHDADLAASADVMLRMRDGKAEAVTPKSGMSEDYG